MTKTKQRKTYICAKKQFHRCSTCTMASKMKIGMSSILQGRAVDKSLCFLVPDTLFWLGVEFLWNIYGDIYDIMIWLVVEF